MHAERARNQRDSLVAIKSMHFRTINVGLSGRDTGPVETMTAVMNCDGNAAGTDDCAGMLD